MDCSSNNESCISYLISDSEEGNMSDKYGQSRGSENQVIIIDSTDISGTTTPTGNLSNKYVPFTEEDIKRKIKEHIPFLSDEENVPDETDAELEQAVKNSCISETSSRKEVNNNSLSDTDISKAHEVFLTKDSVSMDLNLPGDDESNSDCEIVSVSMNQQDIGFLDSLGDDESNSDSEILSVSINQQDIDENDIDPLTSNVHESSCFDAEIFGMTNTAKESEIDLTALASIDDRLQDLHGSLATRPSEDQKARDPLGLTVKLMPHQQHALAWLLWREQQRPSGGILADDMGLGKTLTMISLIIASNATSSEEWRNEYSGTCRHQGGTLVVCPASLLAQWENEISSKCKRNTLKVTVHHGSKRASTAKILSRNDVVITTYNILVGEYNTGNTFLIDWKRVILDEAHVIRNHKTKISEAVCAISAKNRWALTGTPIHNKMMDLYSIMKFIKCSPFDNIRVWKRWVQGKDSVSNRRLATVMRSLMLRRTKGELQAKGELKSLPHKSLEVVFVTLDPPEELVYKKVLIYSRTLFAQFLAQKGERAGMDYWSLHKQLKNIKFTRTEDLLLSVHADVKTHEILVLLLRLRQICVHPWLIHSMLDQEDMQAGGMGDADNLNPRFLSQINSINLHDCVEMAEREDEMIVDQRLTDNLLTSANPVFMVERISSKMRMVLDKVKKILQKGDKIVIVSQWTSTLDLIASHLKHIKDASYNMFTGKVNIKDRQRIVDSFNHPTKNPRILLLSLTAGGVGLNLVGGNHLLLVDIHWNPQLEVQAQDRIYRYGQTKDVHIYKRCLYIYMMMYIYKSLQVYLQGYDRRKYKSFTGIKVAVGSKRPKR